MSTENLSIGDKFKSGKEFSAISRLYENNKEDKNLLGNLLSTTPELISFMQSNSEVYSKIFLIMCSNAFEKRITKFLPFLLSGEINFIDINESEFDGSSKDHLTLFFKKTSFNRGFHTLFEWEYEKNKKNNINKFLAMFGEDLKTNFREKIDSDPKIKEGESSFIVLGRYRNLLVHNGIYDQNLPHEMDLDKIHVHFLDSLEFCAFLFDMLHSAINNTEQRVRLDA